MAVPYKICVIVDRNFGNRLAELPRGLPVWIVDTPSNKLAAQRLWKEKPNEGHLTGITTFNDMESSSPEELLITELGSIDLHHGSYSADRPYTVLEILGTQLTDSAKQALAAYGFAEFQDNPGGFTAIRCEPAP